MRSRRMPALFTTMSMRPKLSIASCTMRCASSQLATLPLLATARPLPFAWSISCHHALSRAGILALAGDRRADVVHHDLARRSPPARSRSLGRCRLRPRLRRRPCHPAYPLVSSFEVDRVTMRQSAIDVQSLGGGRGASIAGRFIRLLFLSLAKAIQGEGSKSPAHGRCLPRCPPHIGVRCAERPNGG